MYKGSIACRNGCVKGFALFTDVVDKDVAGTNRRFFYRTPHGKELRRGSGQIDAMLFENVPDKARAIETGSGGSSSPFVWGADEGAGRADDSCAFGRPDDFGRGDDFCRVVRLMAGLGGFGGTPPTYKKK